MGQDGKNKRRKKVWSGVDGHRPNKKAKKKWAKKKKTPVCKKALLGGSVVRLGQKKPNRKVGVEMIFVVVRGCERSVKIHKTRGGVGMVAGLWWWGGYGGILFKKENRG